MDGVEKELNDEILKDVEITKYLEFMSEIKYRLKTITLYCQTLSKELDLMLLENICLHIRKILELAAMSALVCNKEAFLNANNDFTKLWKGKDIINSVRKYNKYVFPIASYKFTKIDKSDKYWYQSLEKHDKGLLDEKLFDKIYDKCGSILHIKNPYSAQKLDLNYYLTNIPKWIDSIFKTYSIHSVIPYGLKIVRYFVYFDDLLNDVVKSIPLIII